MPTSRTQSMRTLNLICAVEGSAYFSRCPYKNCHYLLSGLRGLNCRGALPYLGSGVAPSARGFSGDRSGVVAVLVGLAMPVLVGAMGLAAETSYWYVHQRGIQNAADAAAIAAATNGTSTYAAEAQAVVAGFYPNGLGTITVTAANPNTARLECHDITGPRVQPAHDLLHRCSAWRLYPSASDLPISSIVRFQRDERLKGNFDHQDKLDADGLSHDCHAEAGPSFMR
jgi:hypothetical protein